MGIICEGTVFPKITSLIMNDIFDASFYGVISLRCSNKLIFMKSFSPDVYGNKVVPADFGDR